MSHTNASHREWEIFNAALDVEPDQRDAFLSRACADDEQLRGAIDRLLDAHDDASSFLETPAFIGVADIDTDIYLDHAADSLVGQPFGRYHITGRLARGGMGVVYEAQQEAPQRTVALKLMRFGFDEENVLRRFQYEVEALGRLRHPGIAQIYEAGTAHLPPALGGDSIPFFAMELITDAKPIIEYANEQDLSLRERLELFARVCDAVHHGHQNGIIHRDLKPANILVDADGDPKIIDFGVARAMDLDRAAITRATEIGQLIGTLQYMSPEQCSAGPLDLDTRSDVYSLGVVLYELVSGGELPYDVRESPLHEASRIIREQPPRSLRTIDRALKGDVETIANKSLEKDPERRYASASELGADVRRYLTSVPITARPASAHTQIMSFCRRHRTTTISGVVLITIVVGSIIGLTHFSLRLREERALAQHESDKLAAVNSFLSSLFVSARPRSRSPNDITLLEVVETASTALNAEPPTEPAVEFSLRSLIGQTMLSLSQFSEAQHHFERAVELAQQMYGTHSEQRYVSLGRLAETLYRQGNVDDAADSITVAHAGLTTLKPETDGELLTLLELRLLILSSRGMHAEAEPLARDLLRIRREQDGPRSLEAVYAMNSLSVVLSGTGKRREAEEFCRLGYEIARDEFPDNALVLNMLRSNYGGYLADRGEFQEGAQLLSESRISAAAIFGEHSVEYVEISAQYASVLEALGDTATAQEIYEDLIPIAEAFIASESFTIAHLKRQLADLLVAKGEYHKAERLLLESVEAFSTSIGPGANFSIGARMALAELYERMSREAEAYEMLLQALNDAKQVLHPTHPALIHCLLNLGANRHYVDDWNGAIEWGHKALIACDQAEEPDLMVLSTCLDLLADSYERLHRTTEAEEMRHRRAKLTEK